MTQSLGALLPAPPDDSLQAQVLLGGGLPPRAEQHLLTASLIYHLDEEAERHLHAAKAIAPDHAAVLIGLYRFYFYKGRLAEALTIAEACLAKAAADGGLPGDWRRVARTDAEFGRYEDVLARFYLFSLKGYAYLQLRLGRADEGRAAVRKLLELDPKDRIGAKVLLDVILHPPEDDDD